MAYGNNENVIEFLEGKRTATVTFSQKRFITKIKRLAKNNPDEVKIIAENKDGSIVAHIPVSYIKLSNRKRTLTDEQRAEFAERLRKYSQSDDEDEQVSTDDE